MFSQTMKSLCRVFSLACVALTPVALMAQDVPNAPKPAAKYTQDYTSRWDFFLGYSYLAPKGTVHVPMPDGTTLPFDYKAVDVGGLFSGAYYFNKWVGAQVEYGLHEWGESVPGTNIGTHGNNDGFQTFCRRPYLPLSIKGHHPVHSCSCRWRAYRWSLPQSLYMGTGTDRRRRHGLQHASLQPPPRDSRLPG